MAKPRINLMIMREGGLSGQVRSYSLPGYLPRLAIIVGTIIVMILVAAIAMTLYFWQRSSDLTRLQNENATLRQSVAHIEQLEAELAYHRTFTRQLAQLVGVDLPQFESGDLSDTLAIAGMIESDEIPHAPAGAEEFETPLAGVPVNECKADPNNRPRGLPLAGRTSRGFQAEGVNPRLRHYGVDIAAREGSPVHAPADGVVVYAGPDQVFGMLLIVDHGGGFKTVYGHNSRLHVRVGDTVLRGDIIALSGNTGQSTAPHLHYEIRRDDQPVDPTAFLGAS
ncbi:MAG: peptidoglycan DD-metalloendopeptidase family protein [candidate division Zixibacteria bacterium]|nr:peptidoglycan DD-metalloendopeptidase family protein [candidate division Zixibacteria bacterium]